MKNCSIGILFVKICSKCCLRLNKPSKVAKSGHPANGSKNSMKQVFQ